MPKLWPVLSQGFTAIFTRLGIQAIPAGPQWWLSDTIVPVSLLDSEITIPVVITPSVEIVSSAGIQISAVAGAVLATTGALPAGDYRFKVLVSFLDGTIANGFLVAHRNAADAADINMQELQAGIPQASINFLFEQSLTLALNERFRVTLLQNSSVGSRSQATIWRTEL